MQIGPRETGDKDARRFQPEQFADVLPHRRGCRRGQRDRLDVSQVTLAETTEPRVVGPEVMAPFADTVRLVNRQQTDVDRRHRLEKPTIAQPFRSDVNQVQLARSHFLHHFGLFAGRQAAVESVWR